MGCDYGFGCDCGVKCDFSMRCGCAMVGDVMVSGVNDVIVV